MNLKLQKKLASKIAKVGIDRIKLDPQAGEELKEAITKEDIRSLMDEGLIKIKKKKGVSKVRARISDAQKKKGRRRGHGRRKGTEKSRTNQKEKWINQIRSQRGLLKKLRKDGKLKEDSYRKLYLKIKGNFFRSKRHLLLYIKKNELLKENNG